MIEPSEWRREDGYAISVDPARLDVARVTAWIGESYWGRELPAETIARSFRAALCFSLFAPSGIQVGFTRLVTDHVRFAWVSDVYVEASERGRGLAKWLLRTIVEHPELRDIQRWVLATRDVHGLYAQFGFEPLPRPQSFMIKARWPTQPPKTVDSQVVGDLVDQSR